MSADEESAPISTSARACLVAFEECLLSASRSVLDTRHYSDIEDQMARFSIWTSNMAVFSAAKSCMDHRLREAKDVQRLVLGMLELLKGRIIECDKIIPQLPRSRGRFFRVSLSQRINDLERATATLAAQVGLFHEVSNVIRKASRDYQNSKAATSFVIRDFEGNNLEGALKSGYTLNLWDRFPESSANIRERLATSMILRRRRVLYRRDRYSSIPMKGLRPVSKPIPKVIPKMKQIHQSIGVDKELPRSQRSEILAPASSQVRSTMNTATTLDPEKFKKASAPSAVSSTRVTDLIDDEELTFPLPPSITGGHMFEMTCPFCLYVLPNQEFLNPKSWRKHILADLEPLVCLFEPCDAPEVLYSHREDWLRHMRKHTEYWRCKAKSHGIQDYANFEEFLDHMKVDHKKSYDDSQIEILAEKGIQSDRPLFDVCPLCGVAQAEKDVGHGDMITHIVGHLRSIALKSLPSLYSDEKDDEHENHSHRRHSRSTINDFEGSLRFDSNPEIARPELDVPKFNYPSKGKVLPLLEASGHGRTISVGWGSRKAPKVIFENNRQNSSRTSIAATDGSWQEIGQPSRFDHDLAGVEKDGLAAIEQNITSGLKPKAFKTLRRVRQLINPNEI